MLNVLPNLKFFQRLVALLFTLFVCGLWISQFSCRIKTQEKDGRFSYIVSNVLRILLGENCSTELAKQLKTEKSLICPHYGFEKYIYNTSQTVLCSE